MFRAYNVKETQWGFCIDGPHGHKWVCKEGDTRSRANTFAKALDRAYLEGQRATAKDVGVLGLLRLMEQFVEEAPGLDPAEAATRLESIAERSRGLKAKLERLRETGKPEEPAEE